MEKALSQGREPVLGPTELLTQWLTQEDPCPPPPILGFGSWEMKGFACISKVFLRVLASVPFLKSQPSPFKDPEVLVTEDNVKSLHCTHKRHKTSRPYSVPVALAALWRQRQENHKLQAGLDYIARPYYGWMEGKELRLWRVSFSECQRLISVGVC